MFRKSCIHKTIKYFKIHQLKNSAKAKILFIYSFIIQNLFKLKIQFVFVYIFVSVGLMLADR